MIVIDASVAVKWFSPEPSSEAAEAFLDEDEVRVAPEHILAEVGQALLRTCRSGGITLDHAQEAVAALSDFVQFVPISDIATAPLGIAAEVACTNYDALYVAVADELDATLLTADARLHRQLAASRYAGRVRLLCSTDEA